jgi:hypothetical protein
MDRLIIILSPDLGEVTPLIVLRLAKWRTPAPPFAAPLIGEPVVSLPVNNLIKIEASGSKGLIPKEKKLRSKNYGSSFLPYILDFPLFKNHSSTQRFFHLSCNVGFQRPFEWRS